MWSAHHFQRVLDMPPVPGLLGLAFRFALGRALGRLCNCPGTMRLHQLPRIVMNFHFPHGVVLPFFEVLTY